jgi:hypothetical protein
MRIRTQVYELAQADLDRFPIWEFALDEEGEDNQDEATVRPWERGEPLDPADGMFVVRATFVLADGTTLGGYLAPPVQGDDSMGTIQPVVVTAQGQVGFWCGVTTPTAEWMQGAYAQLGRDAAGVFPLRYSSDVELADGPVAGTVNGFMHFRSFEDQAVVEVR